MSGISTHVLDLARGRPAEGIAVRLERRVGDEWRDVSQATTSADGRVANLVTLDSPLLPGSWRLRFALAPYFAALGVEAFFPDAQISFEVRDANQHHHVPLLLSPFGYSTYRGS